MADEDIKKITQINEEINDLISTLEKKQRSISNELINLIIEKNQRIYELEQEIEKLKGEGIPEPSLHTKKAKSVAIQETPTVDLTGVLSDLGLTEEPIHPEKSKPSPVENVVSSEEDISFPIISSISSNESEPTDVETTSTVSRYAGVSVLKKMGGPSKFKPRTTTPKPTPESTVQPTATASQNENALEILEELKSEISEETTTHDLYKIMENYRDNLSEIIGFSSIVRDIGTIINKLKHAPDLALDSASIEAFIKKVNEWESKL